ncbi:NAD/NADP octopine/nopaline dehydrogenase family protein [Candidatus Amarolinea dominans]|uniref:NAD/NADP octopine/nopaline dehydrogenase family protein n=1 Tax=Candidatus Amarolinea dominans TaxID=3140696 RepID=UPI0031368BE4|nr:NAD/NADP octopine/nopaline dehydrogenase family protein [Anaerolineae bacterium]
MKIAVLGSGNGACATAADWSLHGHKVRMFDFEGFTRVLEAVEAQRGIYAEGDVNGFAAIEYAGTDIEKTIDGTDLIIVVGPSYSSEPFANAVKDIISEKQVYILSPGSNGGALVTRKIFEKADNAKNVVIAETSTLPYASRNTEPGYVKVYLKLIGGLYLAAIPHSATERALKLFQQVYPGTVAAKNLFQTMLQNGNPVIHPSVTLLNAALIERTQGDFLFYEEGVTPAVGRLMEAIDQERVEIGERLGVRIIPDPELGVIQGYMTDASYSPGYSQAPGFKGIRAQGELDHRYLHEDAGYGLVFLLNLAKSIGVETPHINSVLDIASIVAQRDYRKEAVRTLEGIGYTVEEVNKL